MAKPIAEVLKTHGTTWFKQSEANADVSITYSSNDKNLVFYKDYVTTKKLDEMETRLAEDIMRLKYCSSPLMFYDPEFVDNKIDQFIVEENNGYELHSRQRDAVHMVIKNQICVLTGGPGTGKTTLITQSLNSLKDKGVIYDYHRVTGHITKTYRVISSCSYLMMINNFNYFSFL